jgi:hypothetical protein
MGSHLIQGSSLSRAFIRNMQGAELVLAHDHSCLRILDRTMFALAKGGRA